jgi:hypothetical protein
MKALPDCGTKKHVKCQGAKMQIGGAQLQKPLKKMT